MSTVVSRKRSNLSLLPASARSDEEVSVPPSPLGFSTTPRVQSAVAMNEERFSLLVRKREHERPKMTFHNLSCTVDNGFRRVFHHVWRRQVLLDLIPCLAWVPNYKRPYLAGDVVSGLTVAVLVVPQAISYAMLADLPAEVGLHTAIFPVIVYALLGTSRHLHIGPFAVVSLMVGDAVRGLLGRPGPATTGEPDMEFLKVAAALAAMVGLLQLALGLLSLGAVAILLSDPVVSGVTTAAACFVATSQLKAVFGLPVPPYDDPGSIMKTFAYILEHISETNICALVVSILSVSMLLAMRELNERYKPHLRIPIPADLIVVSVAILLSWSLDLHDRFGLKVIGSVPAGIPPPFLPNGEGVSSLALFKAALPIAIVAYIISVSIVKTFAQQFHYRVDPNQELIALGSANLVGSCFGCFPACGSLSRSAVLASTGANTPLASLLSAAAMVMVVEFATPLFAPLPQAVLAAVILVALRGMLLQYRDAVALYNARHRDLYMWLLAFFATFVLNVGLGVAVAVLGNMLIDVFRRSRPDVSELGWVPGTTVYRDAARYEGLSAFPGVRILRFNADYTYVNREFFARSVLDALDSPSAMAPVPRPASPTDARAHNNHNNHHEGEDGGNACNGGGASGGFSRAGAAEHSVNNGGAALSRRASLAAPAAVWGSPYNTFGEQTQAPAQPAVGGSVTLPPLPAVPQPQPALSLPPPLPPRAHSSSSPRLPAKSPSPTTANAYAELGRSVSLQSHVWNLNKSWSGLDAVAAAAVSAGDERAAAPVRFLILDCSPVNEVDSSALRQLLSVHKQLEVRGVALLLAAPRGLVRDTLERGGFTKVCGLSAIFVSVNAAVEYAVGADRGTGGGGGGDGATGAAELNAANGANAAGAADLPPLDCHMSLASPSGRGGDVNISDV